MDTSSAERILIYGGYWGKETSCFHSRSSSDAAYDIYLMTGFLELEGAAARRSVPFSPHALGGVIVVSPYASPWAIIKGWRAARRRALANAGRIGWKRYLPGFPARESEEQYMDIWHDAKKEKKREGCAWWTTYAGFYLIVFVLAFFYFASK